MAKFQGFETFEVYCDDEFIYIEQMSIEYGKDVIVRIPLHLWESFVKCVEIEYVAAE